MLSRPAPDPAALDLQRHPEGGWFRETWRAPGVVETPHGPRSPATSIHYLLEAGQSSRWHRVRSGELWLWQGGGSLLLYLGGTEQTPVPDRTVVVGPDGVLQHLVEPGQWQAAQPMDTAVLLACVVAPGFEFEDFELVDQRPDVP